MSTHPHDEKYIAEFFKGVEHNLAFVDESTARMACPSWSVDFCSQDDVKVSFSGVYAQTVMNAIDTAHRYFETPAKWECIGVDKE